MLSFLTILFVLICCFKPELKELIAMHSHGASNGGDLKNDTVTIIGATLDLQEKVVEQVRWCHSLSCHANKLVALAGNDSHL